MKGLKFLVGNMFFVLPVIIFILFNGCTITREATLRDAKIKGPVNLPPLRLAENGESGMFKFSPHLNYTPASVVQTNVEAEGYVNKRLINEAVSSENLKLSKINGVQEENNSAGENLTWEIPKISGGLDLEVFLFKSFSITGSFNFAPGSTSGSTGLALQSAKNDIGVRLDIGLLFNNLSYDVYSTVEEKDESLFGTHSETYYFHDEGKTNSKNFYIFLTFNSVNRENMLGGLLSLGYYRQTILDYNPGNLDEGSYLLLPLPVVINNNIRLEASAGYFNLFPAVFFNVNENIRLITGGRLLVEMEMSSNDILFWPVLQMDFNF